MASAADIITYAGIPLAILGILPSLFIILKSILTLREVRRTLSHNRIEALTRGSMLSGIIEVEMPRKSITPHDRDDAAYFSTNEKYVSELKGGTWTVFSWRELVIGRKVVRLQFHDELVVPQAEVELEALVAFLLDRGAEVDTMGWADLRGSGLWTPIGTRLLVAPDGTGRSVLSVAGSEDSEGLLSLKVCWDEKWDGRTLEDLPPYWMEVEGPGEEEKEHGLGLVDDKDRKEEVEMKNHGDHLHSEKRNSTHLSPSTTHLRAPSPPSHTSHQQHTRNHSLSRPSTRLTTYSFATTALSSADLPISFGPLRIKICSSGVDHILLPHSRMKFRPRHLRQLVAHTDIPGSNNNNNNPSSTGNTPALWFSSAATALGAPSGGLWAFAVPQGITAFARLDSVPAGVLELWGIVSAAEIPVWRTPVDTSFEELEERQKQRLKMDRMMAEGRLKGEAWTKAVHERFAQERRERQFEEERKAVAEQARKTQEMVEALGSVRLSSRVVGEACRKWLVDQKRISPSLSSRQVAARVLWEMAVSEEAARAVSKTLDMWRKWADNGGMNRVEYDSMKEDLTRFAYAACLVAVIGECAEMLEGSMVSDLQECMRLYRRVRLG